MRDAIAHRTRAEGRRSFDDPEASSETDAHRSVNDLGVDIDVRLTSFDTGRVRSGWVALPESGKRTDSCLVRIRGWVLGRDSAISALEVRSAGVVLDHIPVSVERRDLAELHPNLPWAGQCGFEGRLELFKLPGNFELELTAVFADDHREPFATVGGSWSPPVSVGEDLLQPVMLTTLGRSGSTWVTRLLGRHPRLVTYAPFRCEPRSASYWLEMYGALSGPGSFQQVLHGELYGPDWWAGTRRSRPQSPPEDPIESWLARQHTRTLLPQAVEQIEAFSREAGAIEGKGPGLTHFAEKFGLNTFVQPFLFGLYPGAREIMLVRDPRDMVCSMLAYNRKKGMEGFGRGQVSTDADYVHWWRRGMRQMLDEWQARSDRSLLLRYEDLILEPVATLSRVFEYVGVEHDEPLMRRVLAEASGLRPDVQKSHQTASDPAASIGRWERDFTPEMREAAEEAFSDTLGHFGYQP